MAMARCSICGRSLNASISPNGEDPCVVCEPNPKRNRKVPGVSPVSVRKEDLDFAKPEAVEAQQKKKVKKKAAKKPAAKKAAKKPAAKKVAKKTAKKKAKKK